VGEAKRETPAQTELRPTSAGAFRVILLCEVIPTCSLVNWLTNFIGGSLVVRTTRGRLTNSIGGDVIARPSEKPRLYQRRGCAPHEFPCQLVNQSIGGDVVGEAERETPAQTELRSTSAGAFRVILPCEVTLTNSLVNWLTNSIGDDVTAEAKRETPAQTELRPTSAGAFRVILPCEVTPTSFLVYWLTNSIGVTS
jgi:hypothetical protein